MTTSRDRRRVYRLTMAALVAALCVGVLVAGVVGAAGLSLGEAFRAFAGLIRHGTDATGSFPDWAPRLLLDLRLPRIALALITGAALSTAGASFQGVFRNPLAEPYLLGVSAGAGLGATVAIVWKPLPALGIYTLPVLAFIGRHPGGVPRVPAGHFRGTHGWGFPPAFGCRSGLHPDRDHVLPDGGDRVRPAHGRGLAHGRVHDRHLDQGGYHSAGGRSRLHLHDAHVPRG